SGQFREDLFYRLNVVTVHLPSLRERRQDIPLLVEYFLRKIGKRIDKRVDAVSDEVMKVFMSSQWPGNVRQLQNVLEHSIILCRGSTITIEDLPEDFRIRQDTVDEGPEERRAYDSMLIAKTLDKTGWNKARAARLLGISRRTLYRKLKEYNIRM
ncbi:MAG TPA: sigma-54-dependent Fis family transcriptional regulator, partial [Nitrospirae bacterium]|nr:sigma-54-dependent Fis family transcriptional regulator [Nitrospirota bacterium]